MNTYIGIGVVVFALVFARDILVYDGIGNAIKNYKDMLNNSLRPVLGYNPELDEATSVSGLMLLTIVLWPLAVFALIFT